jgi:hypothetical protein
MVKGEVEEVLVERPDVFQGTFRPIISTERM